MKLIVGLGNPGKQYQNTRHNVGFRVIDSLTNLQELAPVENRIELKLDKNFNAEVAQVSIDGQKAYVAKPQTFMNASGEAVAKIASFYKIEPCDIWIISDDIDLPLGTIRVRTEGASGGHNGLKSIIEKLGTENFGRIRLGVGSATEQNLKEFETAKPPIEAKDFVLSVFDKREEAIIAPTITHAAELVADALKNNSLTAHTYEVE